MRRERAYRFRIYPDAGQERLLRRTVGSCRLVYNLALEQRRAFGRRGRSITYNSAANELKDLKVRRSSCARFRIIACSKRFAISTQRL